MIDRATCVVLLVSGDEYTAGYDLDLLREIVSDARAVRIVGDPWPHRTIAARLGQAARPAHPFTPDALARLKAGNRTELVSVASEIHRASSEAPHDDFWLSLPYLVFCQMLAFFKAMRVGRHGSMIPCPTGEVNRVVQGVTIHPLSRLKP